MPRGTSPLDQAKVQGRLWTTDVIQSFKFSEWYAGDISTIMASSGAVSSWADRNLKGITATQSTSENKPIFSSSSFFNREGVTFSDSNDYLTRSSNPVSATCSCVAVVIPTNVSGDQYIATIGGSGLATSGSSLSQNISASSKWGAYSGSGSTYRSANSGLIAGTPYILVMDGTGTSMDGGTFFMNGVSDGTYGTIGSLSSVNGSRIGYSANSATCVLRYLGWFNVALPFRLRTLIEGWAAWDSGIVEQCLPVDHPFRNRPPMIGD